MRQWLSTLLPDLASLFLGALLAFAFAPYEIFPLAILAPAGWLLLWLNTSPKRAFWLGFLFGIGLFSAGVYWVYHSVHVFGGVPPIPATLITGSLIAILALFPAMVSYLTTRYFPISQTTKILYAFPAIWVFVEWVRSWLFTGFPWLFLGYSQTGTPLQGYAPIFSVYGVSLAVILTSSLLVNAVLKYRKQQYQRLYFCLLAITAIWITGSLLNLINWTEQKGPALSMSLVQGNIPQEIKWSPDYLQDSLNRYETLSEPLWGKSDFIIWPEAAVPLTAEAAAPFLEKMDEKARASGSHLILGIPVGSGDGESYYNAVMTLGDDKQTYFKRALVPFGEYIPFSRMVSNFFNVMNIPVPETVRGKMDQDFMIVKNVKIFTSICYEITFPELSKTADHSIGFLLTLTNDAWFGEHSSAQAQHLQMAKMRAIELRRPLVFVSNDGITAIINTRGQIDAAAPAHQATVLTSFVQPRVGRTPWMHYGMDPILFILLCLLLKSIGDVRRQRVALNENNTHTSTSQS